VAGSGVSAKVTPASVGVQGPPSWFRHDWLWGLILILTVILAYTPVWKTGFVWDDETILAANPCIIGPLGLKEIWTTSSIPPASRQRTKSHTGEDFWDS
jgi:hypothetical protein